MTATRKRPLAAAPSEDGGSAAGDAPSAVEDSAESRQRNAPGPRRRAREMAVQMLYQIDITGSPPREVIAHFDVGSYRLETSPDAHVDQDASAFQYARRLVEGSLEHREEIDRLLISQAENWRLERMAAVDRNVLRLAVYELLHEVDVPRVVVVDEAIELAKLFGSEQSGAFVNGLLDGMIKTGALDSD